MATQIKRKPIYIVMVGKNKEQTKNESGMRGYLADTLSKTDKLNRDPDENKQFFLNQVYNHMEKVKLAEEESRNIWYFEWNLYLDLRTRLLDTAELFLTNADFYFVEDIKNFEVPKHNNSQQQYSQNYNKNNNYKKYNNNKNNNKQKNQWDSSGDEDQQDKDEKDVTQQYERGNNKKKSVKYQVKPKNQASQDKSNESSSNQLEKQDSKSKNNNYLNQKKIYEEVKGEVQKITSRQEILDEIEKSKKQLAQFKKVENPENILKEKEQLEIQLQDLNTKYEQKLKIIANLQTNLQNILKETSTQEIKTINN